MKKRNRIIPLIVVFLFLGALWYGLPNLVSFGRSVFGGGETPESNVGIASSPQAQAVPNASSPLSVDAKSPASSPSGIAGGGRPLPLVFGERGEVTLDDVPKGRFYYQLVKLTPEARLFALKKLKEFKIPINDVLSLNVDAQGMLFYSCPPALDATEYVAPQPIPGVAAAVSVSSPPLRHSKPGSSKVIYRDFNGHDVTGTAWNSGGLSTYKCVAFDRDGDATTFSDAEQNSIVQIWERISEDFMPFDVDVTTEQPATFTANTTRALITRNTDSTGAYNPSGASAGGVAYLGVFGSASYVATYSPAFVYYNQLGNDANIAEAASHEIGHNLGLSHDGTTSLAYYGGHGSGDISWGPLMGTGYGRNISQWSKGEYYQANNTQDDLAIIAAQIPYRTDDCVGIISGAPVLLVSNQSFSRTGLVGNNTDVDIYKFTTTNQTSVTVNLSSYRCASGTIGCNLGLKLDLLNSSGVLVTGSNSTGYPTVMLSQSINPNSTYYIRVSNSGTGSPTSSTPSGFTSYGSVGQYTLWGSFVGGNSSNSPVVTTGSPSNLTTSGGRITGTVNPNRLATNAYFEYGLSASYGSQTLPSSLSAGNATVSVNATLSGLAAGTTYYYRIAAANSAGTNYGAGGSFRTVSTTKTLSGLVLNGGNLTPTFSANTTAYLSTVGNDVFSVTVKPTASDAAASLSVSLNGGSYSIVSSGSNSSALALTSGNNTINIRVVAQDGVSSQIYSILVNRPPSSSASLSSLTLSAGSISPAFNSSTSNYTLSVPYSPGTTTVTVTTPSSGGKRELQLNGGAFKALTSGVASSALSFSSGNNVVNVRVTAEDNVTLKTYSVTVTRAASSVDLSGLFLKSSLATHALQPTFSALTTNYSITLPNSIAAVSVTPTVLESGSIVSVRYNDGNYTTIAAKSASSLLPMDVGTNLINVKVLSDNNVTSKVYSVVVNRLSAPIAYAASNVTSTSVRLQGEVDVRSSSSAIQFGKTTAYGTLAPLTMNGSSSMIPVSATLTGLEPSTIYYYRLSSLYNGFTDVSGGSSFLTAIRKAVGFIALSGGNATGIAPYQAQYSDFGNPVTNLNGDVAYQATITFAGSGPLNNSGIWATVGGVTRLVACAGTSAPSTGIFDKFSDPVMNSDGRIAFIGSLLVGSANVTSQTEAGIWQTAPGGVTSLVSRAGSVAPDTGGAIFSSFTHVILPDTGGVAFTASLLTGVGNVTTSNNKGLWVTNEGGTLRLAARIGEAPTPTLSTLSVFTPETGLNGQGRHYNTGGNLVVSAGFTSGVNGIYK
ncbi:MAG: cadherin-like beta sandwich domain-containing protein, partial [Verrucomicrobia bacterium]|nr:cadherin-like beta sandwich domain-containing protein [Verrucomicrobiota bacterium]